MNLLKVIVACAAATANLFTGMLYQVPCEDPSAGQYAEAQKGSEMFAMDTMIQNTVSTVLAQYQEKNESELALRSQDTSVGEADGASSEQMNEDSKTAPGENGREVANAKSAGKANAAKTAEGQKKSDVDSAEKGSVEDGAGKALASAGDTYGSVPASAAASSSNAPAGIADSKPASAAANSASSTQPASAASAPASAVGQQASPAPVSSPAAADPSATPTPEAVAPKPTYDHTTSIYSDGYEALLRVEYYDENNKLFEYSSVTDYDKDTNSYTETVYRWDDETDSQVTMRTDTYVNGELVSSESP